jgi:hypothetical protein
MPAGFGIDGPDATAAARAALARVKIPAAASSHQLAGSAIEGIQAIARANGHALPVVKVPAAAATAGGGGSSNRLVLVLIIVAVLAAGGVVALQLRIRSLRRAGTGA